MKLLNRDAVMVRPKKPFIDWIYYNDSSVKITPEEIKNYRNIYLIPEMEDDEARQKCLEKNCQEIFQAELFEWYTDETLFPKDLNYKVFKEWFEIEMFEMVVDTVDKPIKTESY